MDVPKHLALFKLFPNHGHVFVVPDVLGKGVVLAEPMRRKKGDDGTGLTLAEFADVLVPCVNKPVMFDSQDLSERLAEWERSLD